MHRTYSTLTQSANGVFASLNVQDRRKGAQVEEHEREQHDLAVESIPRATVSRDTERSWRENAGGWMKDGESGGERESGGEGEREMER